MLNLLTDFIAAIVFVVSYFFFFDQNIYWAAILFLFVLAVQFMILNWIFRVKISNLMWIAFVLGMTTALIAFALQFPDAIKWRPTAILWTISSVCLLGLGLGRFNVFKWIAGEWMEIVEFMWKAMCVVIAIGYLFAGTVNLVVAYAFSEQVWVLFVAFAWLLSGLIVNGVVRIVIPLMREKIEREAFEFLDEQPSTD
ncbi:MAG: hypothetical protein F4219_08860 [Gammaproteobacteria bacterium]|nr:hypothetical protein [Gammaproteobacteria bacterium]